MHAVLTSLYDWGNRAAWVAAALSIPFWLYFAYAAPKAQLLALQHRQDTAASESRAFCEKYGMASGTSRNHLCADDLIDFRAKQGQRIAGELNGNF